MTKVKFSTEYLQFIDFYLINFELNLMITTIELVDQIMVYNEFYDLVMYAFYELNIFTE